MKINIPQNIKKIAQKSFTQAKKIKPGHLMFGMMLVMTCLNKCSPVTDCTNATDAKWAYEAGQQKVKDSLKILELEQKIAADSMKIYHLTEKFDSINQSKLVKNIRKIK